MLGVSLDVGEADGKAGGEAQHGGVDAVGAYAGAGAGGAEIVGHGCAAEHAEGKDGRVAVAFAGHEELSAGAAAGEGEGEAGRDHAAEVPEAVGVGDGLLVKAEVEAPEHQIADERGEEEGGHAQEEMGVAEEERSRKAPMVQKRLRWARTPMTKARPMEARKGACMEPGPLTE